MAEFFIYPDIATIFISDFICANNIAQKKIESVIDEVHSMYPNFFNLDMKRDIKISENIIMR